ncbi:MAG: bifunctional DNA primase/polymerase [Candidatus Bathyarchaeia archaeon]
MKLCLDASATTEAQSGLTNVRTAKLRNCVKMESNLKEAAYNYWLQGLNIVLLKEKNPLHEWKHLQTERQKESDYQALPWNEAEGFALIGGSRLENGLFFAAIDFDVKNLSEEAKEKGRLALKHLPITQVEETPSGGQHWIYYSHTKPKTISAYHNIAALELIGEGKLCIMAPSIGYERLNDNQPTIVQDLESLFYECLSKAGVKAKENASEKLWFSRKDLTGKPYTGNTPPCISGLYKGTVEGARNEYGIRIASFLINFKGLNPNYALKRLKDWNRFNSPPLCEKELENLVKSALKGGYIYGCEDETLKQHCNVEECPIAQKTKCLTSEEVENAERILKDPKLLEYVVEYGRKRLIGEDNALILNFVALCSGQTKYPLSIILSGFSGSGKNESLRAVKPLIPKEWIFEFTTSTPEAIKYIGEEFSGTIIVYEAKGVKGETGSLGLQAIGEGEAIETIYPVRNDITRKMELRRAKTNAKNFITTESGLDIHPDLFRRVFKYEMNYSDALTKRVVAKKLRDAAYPESLRKLLRDEGNPMPYSEEEFQNALRANNWQAEAIVFPPPELLNLLDMAVTKEQKVALRTHVEKILNFVRVLALINQKRRLQIRINENSYVIASPEDFKKALKILQATLRETVTRLGKRQQEVLSLFKEGDALDKHKVAEKLKISTDTASKALRSLAKAGYLKENTNMKPYTYEPLQNKPDSLGKLENPSQYCLFWQKSLEKFLKGIAAPLQPRDIVFQIFKPEENEANTVSTISEAENKEISQNIDFKKEKTLTPDIRVSEEPFKDNLSFFKQNSQKNLGFQNIPNGKGLFLWRRILPSEKCELCGQLAVEYEINHVNAQQILRRCQSCFNHMHQIFTKATWRNLQDFEV